MQCAMPIFHPVLSPLAHVRKSVKFRFSCLQGPQSSVFLHVGNRESSKRSSYRSGPDDNTPNGFDDERREHVIEELSAARQAAQQHISNI
eukprot:1330839-Pleurochrysis_carterae.AAC.3